MKRCSGCGEVKPLADFHKSGRKWGDGHRTRCKVCLNAYARNYHRESVRSITRHGITVNKSERLFESQGGNCPICPVGEISSFLVIHHDHECCPGQWSCGKCITAVLCKKHNTASGGFNDDPDQMRAMADLIEKSRAWLQVSSVFTRK